MSIVPFAWVQSQLTKQEYDTNKPKCAQSYDHLLLSIEISKAFRRCRNKEELCAQEQRAEEEENAPHDDVSEMWHRAVV